MVPSATRILITGATGFLGRNILESLAGEPGVTTIAACRDPRKLTPGLADEVRAGDLTDGAYRRAVVRDVDVVCHAGTWASMWGHRELEHQRFYLPSRDLIEQAIVQGVRRFIMASTVAIGTPGPTGQPHDDRSRKTPTGFWPHLDYLMAIDDQMQAQAHRGTQMVTLRLGHFVGRGNRLGLVPAIVPRLNTYLVPWLGGGRRHLPLIADTDLGTAFKRAALADGLSHYESFNICGPSFPQLREVVSYIAAQADVPKPWYSVPYSAGYAFGWLMEKLHPLLPGSSPFLTRSIVRLCEDWVCPNASATEKLGYVPQKPWQQAVDEHLADLAGEGYPWPRLYQA